jgi:transposase-like protein
MKCPKCESQRYVKASFNHNRQRCKCKNCKHQFTQTTDKNNTKHAFALYRHIIGLSMNAIGRMLSRTLHHSIQDKEFGDVIKHFSLRGA